MDLMAVCKYLRLTINGEFSTIDNIKEYVDTEIKRSQGRVLLHLRKRSFEDMSIS